MPAGTEWSCECSAKPQLLSVETTKASAALAFKAHYNGGWSPRPPRGAPVAAKRIRP